MRLVAFQHPARLLAGTAIDWGALEHRDQVGAVPHVQIVRIIRTRSPVKGVRCRPEGEHGTVGAWPCGIAVRGLGKPIAGVQVRLPINTQDEHASTVLRHAVVAGIEKYGPLHRVTVLVGHLQKRVQVARVFWLQETRHVLEQERARSNSLDELEISQKQFVARIADPRLA